MNDGMRDFSICKRRGYRVGVEQSRRGRLLKHMRGANV